MNISTGNTLGGNMGRETLSDLEKSVKGLELVYNTDYRTKYKVRINVHERYKAVRYGLISRENMIDFDCYGEMGIASSSGGSSRYDSSKRGFVPEFTVMFDREPTQASRFWIYELDFLEVEKE